VVEVALPVLTLDNPVEVVEVLVEYYLIQVLLELLLVLL
jgi:hypothetical protein